MTPSANRPAETPAATERLFPHYSREDLASHPDFLIGRLLEDGDGADLRWLFRNLPADSVHQWFSRRAGRQLSARSRAYWALVLGQQAGPAAAVAEELWPL